MHWTTADGLLTSASPPRHAGGWRAEEGQVSPRFQIWSASCCPPPALRAIPVCRGREEPMTVTIWHNPRCSKSRQTLELLHRRASSPRSATTSRSRPARPSQRLIDMIGDPAELIRDGRPSSRRSRKRPIFQGRNRQGDRHPILLQRPIVVAEQARAIGRPPNGVAAPEIASWLDGCCSGQATSSSSMSSRTCSITRSV
jgi:arsenate reductase